jgi:CRP-like cAMP-binding protein
MLVVRDNLSGGARGDDLRDQIEAHSNRADAPEPGALDGDPDTTRRAPSFGDHFCPGRPCDECDVRRAGCRPVVGLSHAGREAVVAVLDEAHFVGEGCLAGQSQRMATATALTACTIVVVDKPEMVRRLHATPAFADRFLIHMLTTNIRIEEDLIDQLFNSSEKSLARTLLLLARYGEPDASHRILPRVSQETLAEMVGTTRSRVNFFMNKFRKLGFIEYNGGLKINNSLLSVVLRD